MPKFKFDDVEYDTDNLSNEAKGHLESLIFSEQQLRRLNMESALTQTARNGYLMALRNSLPSQGATASPSDQSKKSDKK